MAKKYHIIVYGCQMNISDSERLAGVLEFAKYQNTPNIKDADLVAVTMCSVRQSAVDRIHGLAQKFKELKKTNKNLKTILTGCILEKDKNTFIEGFDHVIDIKEIEKIPGLLKIVKNKKHKNYLDITPKYFSQFSANVPIMTGCNNFCSYCVVPHTREREISRPVKLIILEIKKLVKNGYKEIWLLGQNVNSYKGNYSNFPELLKMINEIPGDFWVRFTSSHPKDFSDKLISAMASCKKVTPYLNLPVQSGDDKVLKTMNRHYSVKDYKNKIKKLREKIPHISLSTDIIVGFPGETKKQFENTARLFRDIKYDMAYINKYSPRTGTAAAKLKDNVSIEEKKRREKVLTEILKKTALAHNKKYVGKTVKVLIDCEKNGFFYGKTDTYKTVKIRGAVNIKPKTSLIGNFADIKITKAYEWALEGIFA